jgi:formylglycine-generating enzyme required for sulfatase activity
MSVESWSRSLRVYRGGGRGGGWFFVPQYARVAYRDYSTPGLRYDGLGFRLLRRVS